MYYSIENDYLSVKVNSIGAELSSLYSKVLNREFIWQPGAEIFPNQAKNLFPNVGMVNLERFLICGKEYPASQHGVVKNMEFAVSEITHDKIVFEVCSEPELKRYLPYDFTFKIEFKIEDDTLIQTYIVDNHAYEDMYFGVGAHTGFYCPISLMEKAEDYILQFENQEFLTEIIREPVNSLRTGETKKWELTDSRLQLSDYFFDDGAKIFTDFTRKEVRLLSKKSGLFVDIDFEDFPYCTLWSRKGPLYYICIEPWCGLPDSVDTNHIFEEKEGNIKLAGKTTFYATQKIKPGKQNL